MAANFGEPFVVSGIVVVDMKALLTNVVIVNVLMLLGARR